MLKRKTGTILVSKAGLVGVYYRGKVLRAFLCDSELEAMNAAREWALSQKFTMLKYKYIGVKP